MVHPTIILEQVPCLEANTSLLHADKICTHGVWFKQNEMTWAKTTPNVPEDAGESGEGVQGAAGAAAEES
jgi:hypothetical protein